MKKFKIKYYHLLTPSVYLLISYLCLTTQPFPSSINTSIFSFPGIDKLVHGTLYFMLTFSTMFVLMKMDKLGKKLLTLAWTVTIPILFGGFVELAQLYCVKGRSGDWLDFAANTIGVVIAYFAFKVLSTRLSWR
jgi:VanZ family protein